MSDPLVPLDRLERAVKRRALTPADIDALRSEIGRLSAIAPNHPTLRRSLSGLATIDRQLSRLTLKLGERHLEPSSFQTLPAVVKRSVIARLDAAGARIGRPELGPPIDSDANIANAQKPGADEADAGDLAFRCAAQHRRCCARRPPGRLWCHLALAVCLVRTLLPLIHPSSPPGPVGTRS